VAGYYLSASGNWRALLWQNGTITDLGTLGGNQAIAFGINAAGHIMGTAMTASGSREVFFYANGVMQDTGVSTIGWENSGINDEDEIVGIDSSYHAFLLSNGVFEDLGTLGGSESQAQHINNAGQIVGFADTASSGAAFIWQNGSMAALPLLSGTNAGSAQCINASGQIVGTIWFSSGGAYHTCVWPAPNSAPIDLGTLGGLTSYGTGINSAGVAVGRADTSTGASHAFIWDQTHGMRDLNTLIPANSGWVLDIAQAINDAGMIVAHGIGPNGVTHALLLIGQPQVVFGNVTQLTRHGNTISATLQFTNTGAAPASNAKLTAETLNGVSTTTSPLPGGTIPTGATVSVTLTFPGTAGKSGQIVPLSVSGTYGGVSATGSQSVTLP
jgi:probable HAF family extracellular repeat protein